MSRKEHLNSATTINLLSKEDNRQPKGKKIFKVSKFIVYLFIILITVIGVFSYQVIFSENGQTSIGGWSFLKNMGELLKGKENKLAGEDTDRINILFLGNGGPGHDGANLTDTIMLASVKPSSGKVALFSIPRDLLVDLPTGGKGKINNVYAYAEAQDPGTGGLATMSVVSRITGVDIPYYVQVNFEGFEEFIDDIGGVKVHVDRTFSDYQYPAPNYKYQVVRFEEGLQTMDGDEALKYARSRHGNNGESGDFARSKRQQKVIEAVRERALSYKTFLNPKKINNILNTFSDNSSTNLEVWEIVRVARLTQDVNHEDITNTVLEDGPNGILYGTKYGEAFVLRPKKDDFTDVQFLVKNIFLQQQNIEEKQIAKIEIKNGTPVNGLAYSFSQKIKGMGYEVVKIGNAPTQDYDKTSIYDLTDGNKEEVSEILETIFDSKPEGNVPDWIQKVADPEADFFLILGADNTDL